MAIDISSFEMPPFRDEVTIREVYNNDDMIIWTDILSRGYGLPHEVCALFSHYGINSGFSSASPVRYFLGCEQGTPVASSMLTLQDGIAGIYRVATLPEARCKGIGAAITAVPLSEAQKLGYRMAILQATAAGHPVYRKLDFADYGSIFLYLRISSNQEQMTSDSRQSCQWC